jgi:ribosomal-protein-alanine N-acetyltransferase
MIVSVKVGAHNVRRAGLADAGILAAIHATCFAKPWDAAEMAAFLGAPGCLSLLAGGPQGNPPRGFLIARRTGDEAELLTLAVLPTYRGSGLGRALLGACLEALRQSGAEVLFLEVGENNAAARNLYQSFSAVPVGRRPGYYEHGGDAIIFSLAL